MKKIVMICLGILMGLSAFAAPTVEEILRKVESNGELKTDGTAKIVMTNQKADQGAKVTEAMYYRKDSDDSFLIIMLAPEADKGNGYLRVDDNMWMYRKNTRTFQHINRDESIGGSNAKSSDFEKRKLFELYKADVDKNGKEVVTEEMLGKIPCYKFNVIAKVNDVDYPKKTMYVEKENFITRRTLDYSLSGTLMQTSSFMQYTQIEGKWLAVKMLFVDEFEKGNKTLVEISNISTKKLDEKIFTKAYLENLSK